MKVPHDRTIKQPATAFCRNPECRFMDDKEFSFEIDHDHIACPKCGADRAPMIGILVLTHWLIVHPSGPISSRSGKRYAIACDDKRAYIATSSNLEAATDQVKIANCPGCLAVANELNIPTAGETNDG